MEENSTKRAARFQIRLKPDLEERISDYAARHSISRNAAINFLCSAGLDAYDAQASTRTGGSR